eukprot:scaffold888_cov246-Pinguiococcus_pyrenoidosus.AAC.18
MPSIAGRRPPEDSPHKSNGKKQSCCFVCCCCLYPLLPLLVPSATTACALCYHCFCGKASRLTTL